MKAIILAAGIASRLRPLTNHRPKCLLDIKQRCLLGRTIDGLIANGIQDVTIVTGYRQEQIIEFVGENFPDLKVRYIYNEEYATTNNIYSLWLAREQFRGEDTLLLDSDVVFDPQIVKNLLAHPGSTCLALKKHQLSDEEIKVIPDAQGKVAEISKTCSTIDAIGESIGIEKMSGEYTQALADELDRMIQQEKQTDIFYEAAFQRLIAQGHTFDIVDTTSLFAMELDTISDYLRAVDKLPEHLEK